MPLPVAYVDEKDKWMSAKVIYLTPYANAGSGTRKVRLEMANAAGREAGLRVYVAAEEGRRGRGVRRSARRDRRAAVGVGNAADDRRFVGRMPRPTSITGRRFAVRWEVSGRSQARWSVVPSGRDGGRAAGPERPAPARSAIRTPQSAIQRREAPVASSVVEENKKNQGSEGDKEKDQSAPGADRHQLVQRLLDSSASLPAFINDLLTTQAVTVAGTEAAGFLLERHGATRPTSARSPTSARTSRPRRSGPQAIAAFQDLIKPCVEQGRDGAIEVAAVGRRRRRRSTASSRCCGPRARSSPSAPVITRCINVERARQRLMSMQLVAGYFELFTLRRNSDQARTIAQSHQHVLQLATSVATAEGFESAAMNLCNELATRAHATRVSVGWLKGTKIKVVAHQPHRAVRQEAGTGRPAREGDGGVHRPGGGRPVRPRRQEHRQRHPRRARP